MSERNEIARLLMLNFPGWRCWFGSMTEAWWSLPPPGSPYRALIEAQSPRDLAARIREIDASSLDQRTSDAHPGDEPARP